MSETFGDTSESQSTPPTGPSSAPSRWPTAVGIISIVIGSWGLLGGVLGAVAVLFLDSYLGTIMQATSDPRVMKATMDVMQEYAGYQVALTLIAAVLGALLLVAGILILRRRRSSSGMVRVWALLRMLVVVGSALIGFRIQQAVFQSFPGEQMNGVFGSVFSVMSAVFALVIGWAYPVFLLIWFSRGKVREDIASWT